MRLFQLDSDPSDPRNHGARLYRFGSGSPGSAPTKRLPLGNRATRSSRGTRLADTNQNFIFSNSFGQQSKRGVDSACGWPNGQPIQKSCHTSHNGVSQRAWLPCVDSARTPCGPTYYWHCCNRLASLTEPHMWLASPRHFFGARGPGLDRPGRARPNAGHLSGL